MAAKEGWLGPSLALASSFPPESTLTFPPAIQAATTHKTLRQGLYVHNQKSQKVPRGLFNVCVCCGVGSAAIYSAYPHSTPGRQVEWVQLSTFPKKALER